MSYKKLRCCPRPPIRQQEKPKPYPKREDLHSVQSLGMFSRYLLGRLLITTQAEMGDAHIGMGSKGLTFSNDGDLHGIGHGGVGGEVSVKCHKLVNKC
jgi:hypothetical protein